MNSKPPTCLICLRNDYNDVGLQLFDLFARDWDNVIYLNKLLSILNVKIAVYERMLICSSCFHDLSKAYEFKEKAIKALKYWSAKFDKCVTISNKITLQEFSDANDNNENILTDSIANTEFTIKHNVERRQESPGITVVEVNKKLETKCLNSTCSKCKLVFLDASELIHHSCYDGQQKLRVRMDPKKRKNPSIQNKCDYCDLSFSKPWKLKKHLKVHIVDKKFVCKFCNHSFKQSYHLHEHLTCHTGERNFSCEICGKKFQRISSQKRHMRTHSATPGEKSKKTPFLCTICGKSFPYSNGAQRHMRIHTGDKRYGCEVCGRKFNQSTHLKVHLRTHTGERPYMCSICGDTFSLKASLHKHTAAHSDSNNDVKIFQNLEPNLSQTHCTNDQEKTEYDLDDMSLYDHQGWLVVGRQS